MLLLNRTSIIATVLRDLELGTLEFIDELGGLVRGMEAARGGTFSRDMMEPWELEGYVRELSAELPAGLGLVASADGVDLCYEVASVQLAAVLDGYVLAVDLPLAPRG